MSKYEIKFEKCSEVWAVINKMKDIIKEYGQVRVADVKELCGQESTYTDNKYGWKDLTNYFATYDVASKKYILHLNQPERLAKGCTCDICIEDTIAAYCKADCLATQNIILTMDKMDLESELEKVKKELEEAQLLNNVLKKEIDNLKWEKTWYEAHYEKAQNDIKDLKEQNENVIRSYGRLSNDLFRRNKQFKEAIYQLKRAEFYMNSGQDIHSIYPQWFVDYHRTVNDIKEFLEKNKED